MASDDEGEDYERIRQSRNRKEKKAGGWQALGLDHSIFKGIEKKGYRQPTPIQRKTIPCIMDGRDVVAMSRTGSGKTAAFVVPMLQRLKKRETKGTRALIVAPTRELALQTHKVVKDLGRFTGLESACLVGGDSMDDQFATLHESPDVLIATPGRLLHIVVEMNLRLASMEYIVFDEADRLFEMGFLDQLTEILKRLPESRQTLLFSATLPKMLVDFAKAGLTDPVLVRLDVDEKVSELLSMVFVLCRPGDRIPATIALAKKARDEEKQTVLFCATMKHVEYIVAILHRAGVECAFVYSQLDATARKMNIAKFRDKKVYILVVTDVAARGVDIPLLDTVINVHFPPKPKLFVHRAGRVARAGAKGTAVSLVTPDELAYLADLFLFFGKPMVFAKDGDEYDPKVTLVGRLPDKVINAETDFLVAVHDNNIDMHDLEHKANAAAGKYGRTRPPPSAESARRVKTELRLAAAHASFHPNLKEKDDKQQAAVLNALANYRANATIFELHASSKVKEVAVMKAMRKNNWEKIRARKEEEEKNSAAIAEKEETAERNREKGDEADEEAIAAAFTELIGKSGKKLTRSERMEEERKLHYIAYAPADANSEKQLGVDFSREAESVSVDITGDDERSMQRQGNKKKWDRKLKRFVGEAGNDPAKKRIRTEDGTLLPASYKTGRYEEWMKKQKMGFGRRNEEEGEDGYEDEGEEEAGAAGAGRAQDRQQGGKRWGKPKGPKASGGSTEIRRPEQILKTRKKKESVQSYQAYRRVENLKKKSGKFGKPGGGGDRGRGEGQSRRGRGGGAGFKSSRGGGGGRGGKFNKKR